MLPSRLSAAYLALHVVTTEGDGSAVMLKDASNAKNTNSANNGYVATGNKDQKPLTMAIEHVVSVVVHIKDCVYLCVSQVFLTYLFIYWFLVVCERVGLIDATERWEVTDERR